MVGEMGPPLTQEIPKMIQGSMWPLTQAAQLSQGSSRKRKKAERLEARMKGMNAESGHNQEKDKVATNAGSSSEVEPTQDTSSDQQSKRKKSKKNSKKQEDANQSMILSGSNLDVTPASLPSNTDYAS